MTPTIYLNDYVSGRKESVTTKANVSATIKDGRSITLNMYEDRESADLLRDIREGMNTWINVLVVSDTLAKTVINGDELESEKTASANQVVVYVNS